MKSKPEIRAEQRPDPRAEKTESPPSVSTTRPRLRSVHIEGEDESHITAQTLRDVFRAHEGNMESFLSESLANVETSIGNKIEDYKTFVHDRFQRQADQSRDELAIEREQKDDLVKKIAADLDARKREGLALKSAQETQRKKLSVLERGVATLTDRRTVGGAGLVVLFVLLHHLLH